MSPADRAGEECAHEEADQAQAEGVGQGEGQVLGPDQHIPADEVNRTAPVHRTPARIPATIGGWCSRAYRSPIPPGGSQFFQTTQASRPRPRAYLLALQRTDFIHSLILVMRKGKARSLSLTGDLAEWITAVGPISEFSILFGGSAPCPGGFAG